MELIPDWPSWPFCTCSLVWTRRNFASSTFDRPSYSCIEGTAESREVRRILHLTRIYPKASVRCPRQVMSPLVRRSPRLSHFILFSIAIHLRPRRRSSLNKGPPAILEDPRVSDAQFIPSPALQSLLSRILRFLPGRGSQNPKGRRFFFTAKVSFFFFFPACARFATSFRMDEPPHDFACITPNAVRFRLHRASNCKRRELRSCLIINLCAHGSSVFNPSVGRTSLQFDHHDRGNSRISGITERIRV